MTTTTVSGVTSSDQSITSGNQVVVESGGVTISYTVLADGYEVVDNGGTASATTVSNGGVEFVYSGGTATGTIVSSGGVEFVENNGTTSGTTVSSGGVEFVYSGTANATTVSSGGEAYVYSGGTANGTTVSKGGVEFVYSGGTANGVTDEAGGFVVALPGADVTGVTGSGTVVSTGVFYDSAGTPAAATAVSGLSLNGLSDQVDVLQGGTTTATSLAEGATENVFSGGTASGTIVSDGGTEHVYASGTASGTIVSVGGAEDVYSGTTIGTTVSSGGAAYVFSGTTTGTTVSSGGVEYVYRGGLTSGTMVSNGGGEVVYGTASGTIVSSGGGEFVSSGGTATGITVSNGGFDFVYSGGTLRGVNDAASGIVVALPGANVTNVSGGGTVISTGVLYDNAGTPVSKTAVSGLSLDGRGFTDQVYVLQGGSTTATSLAGGAAETVFSGGTASGTIVSSGGAEIVSSGGTASGTMVSSGGAQDVDSGTTSGTIVSSGGAQYVYSGTANGTIVSSGGTERVYFGGTANGVTVSSGGVEYVDGGAVTSTTFAPGGALDLGAIAFGSGETASIDGSAVLTVTSGGNTVYSQQLAPSDAGYAANVTSAPDGDTLVTIAVCFASGTAIRTTRGDVAVEALTVGDIAVTASGARRPIRWLGHRTIDCRNHPRPNDVHPVRIAAHSFGADLPERDLYLSPGHPVLVGADEDGTGGHLVPIMCLVNGTTIKRVPVDAVTYWHVELDAHDILLAEGLPAESYLDWGDRGFFTEGADHRLVNPDFVVPGLAARCRPVALDGPVVEAERRRLDMVFASRLAAACDWPDEHGAVAPTRGASPFALCGLYETAGSVADPSGRGVDPRAHSLPHGDVHDAGEPGGRTGRKWPIPSAAGFIRWAAASAGRATRRTPG